MNVEKNLKASENIYTKYFFPSLDSLSRHMIYQDFQLCPLWVSE